MRWLALGVVLGVLVLGVVRIAGPTLLEPAGDGTRWLFGGLVALVAAVLSGLALTRAALPERAWATLGLVAPGLVGHAIVADAFESAFPMLGAAADRPWASLVLLTYGVVAATGLVMGRR